jgi:carnitine-CoA ligase
MRPASMIELLSAGRTRQPDARLVRFGDQWRTYAQVDTDSDRAAGILAVFGVRQGDRVATLSTNRSELIDVLLGCAKLGAVHVPLNPYLKGDFLRHQLADSGASVLCADADGVASAASVLVATSVGEVLSLDAAGASCELPPGVAAFDFTSGFDAAPMPYQRAVVELDDLAQIIYTSGTTGRAKGCMVNHGYIGNSPRRWAANGWLRPGDVVFTSLPLFHFGGQNTFLGALVADTQAVIETAFSASGFISRAAAVRATVLRGVGSMAVAVLRQPERPDDASHGFRQGNFPPLSPENHLAFERRFGLKVNNGLYGQSECIPVTFEQAGTSAPVGSCGKAMSTIEVRLVDDHDEEVRPNRIGEFVVRPKERYVMFSGYWNNPQATLEAWRGLWHHTGDYGRMDEAGNFYFVDRKKDALRRRGENISSVELENAIRVFPGIQNAAIVAVPSDMGEDDIQAFVVFDAETEVPTPGAFFDFLKETIPYFAMPRYVAFLGELPVTQTGRIQKHLLRAGDYQAKAEWDFSELGLSVGVHERRGSSSQCDNAVSPASLINRAT